MLFVQSPITIANNGIVEASNIDFQNIYDPGTGQPGNITIEANNLDLINRGAIAAATQSETDVGGIINLNIAEDITLKDNSFISAQAFGDANGGNLNIDARFIVASPSNGVGNDLVATADQGRGGNINLNVEQIFGLETGEAINDETGNFIRNNNNDLDASSDVLGLDGTVNINTSGINPVQGATELPTNIIEAEQTTEQACQANREAAAKNNLIINGKGGIPAPPDQPLTSQNIIVIGQYTDDTYITPQPVKTSQASLTSENTIAIGQYSDDTYTTPEPVKTSQGMIQPARGIKVTKDGQVILTPYATNNAGERIPEIKRNCI